MRFSCILRRVFRGVSCLYDIGGRGGVWGHSSGHKRRGGEAGVVGGGTGRVVVLRCHVGHCRTVKGKAVYRLLGNGLRGLLTGRIAVWLGAVCVV